VLFCSPRSEKVKAGLFSSVEEYTIETLPFKYLAKRKFTDFQWLREKLSLDFAGIYVDQRLMQIPPVSSKTFKEAFLQNFLNSLLERPELRNAKVLQEFLVGDDLKAIYKNVVRYALHERNPKERASTHI
jgi:hypothetical protein